MSPILLSYVVDPLERAGRTFAQQFVFVLLGGTGGLLITQNWLVAVNSAGFAALLSILMSVLTFKVPPLPAGADLTLRVVKTFIQSFVGTVTAASVLDLSHVDWKGSLAIAFPVAFSALVTGLAALGIANTRGASLIPAGVAEADNTAPESDDPGVVAGDQHDVFEEYDPDLPIADAATAHSS